MRMEAIPISEFGIFLSGPVSCIPPGIARTRFEPGGRLLLDQFGSRAMVFNPHTSFPDFALPYSGLFANRLSRNESLNRASRVQFKSITLEFLLGGTFTHFVQLKVRKTSKRPRIEKCVTKEMRIVPMNIPRQGQKFSARSPFFIAIPGGPP